MPNIEESILNALEIIETPNTVLAYHKGLNYFTESLQGISLDEDVSVLTLKDFVHFVEWISKKNLSRNTKRLYLSAVNFLINYLVVNDLFDFSYGENEKLKRAIKLYILNSHKTFVPKVPRAGDSEKMYQAVLRQKTYSPLKERNIALIQFLATSGCRRSEVANLKVSDVDLHTCSAMIYGGKGNKDRRIIISPKTCEVLARYWKARGSSNPSDPAFARHDKSSRWREGLSHMSSQAVYGVVEKIRKLAGVKFSPHSFRHDVATKLARQNIQLAKEQLGHVSEITTGKYLGFTQEELSKWHKEIFA